MCLWNRNHNGSALHLWKKYEDMCLQNIREYFCFFSDETIWYLESIHLMKWAGIEYTWTWFLVEYCLTMSWNMCFIVDGILVSHYFGPHQSPSLTWLIRCTWYDQHHPLFLGAWWTAMELKYTKGWKAKRMKALLSHLPCCRLRKKSC